MKPWLLGKTLSELTETAVQFGFPTFVGKQLADWLYKKKVSQIDEMKNLSKAARSILSEHFEVGGFAPSDTQQSKDGTRKYLFPTCNNHNIESVIIPDGDRATLCVSAQAGCKMGCKFCMTARQGFQQNLSAGEILGQFTRVSETNELSNAVYMGMGEPMDNLDEVLKSLEILTAPWGWAWSPRRITVSTIGVTPKMKRFLDENQCHLAVSLHNPFADERYELMPIQKAYPISEVIDLIKQYDFTGQRRVSFEYILFEGINDTLRHANELVRLLNGLECRVNLIRFHAIPDCALKSSNETAVENFKNHLNKKGILTTVRASRGEDILAACGLLSTKNAAKQQ